MGLQFTSIKVPGKQINFSSCGKPLDGKKLHVIECRKDKLLINVKFSLGK